MQLIAVFEILYKQSDRPNMKKTDHRDQGTRWMLNSVLNHIYTMLVVLLRKNYAKNI